jgi:arylsulfatase A-like enzyme
VIDRRNFLRIAGALSMNQVTQPTVPVLSRLPGEEPRQAIIILGESVRYDMLNCNREIGLKTPNFDRIAAGGISFERAYDCQPVCAPARSAVWTGLYPHSNGVWGNSMPVGDTAHTIGQRLTDQGVHCAFIGKWHLSGTDYFDTGRPAPGWDPNYWLRHADLSGGANTSRQAPLTQPKHGRRSYLDGGVVLRLPLHPTCARFLRILPQP